VDVLDLEEAELLEDKELELAEDEEPELAEAVELDLAEALDWPMSSHSIHRNKQALISILISQAFRMIPSPVLRTLRPAGEPLLLASTAILGRPAEDDDQAECSIIK